MPTNAPLVITQNISDRPVTEEHHIETLNREVIKTLKLLRAAWNSFASKANTATMTVGSAPTQASFSVGKTAPDATTPAGIYYQVDGSGTNRFFAFNGAAWVQLV